MKFSSNRPQSIVHNRGRTSSHPQPNLLRVEATGPSVHQSKEEFMLRLRSSHRSGRASFQVFLSFLAAAGIFLSACFLTHPMTSHSAQLAPASIRGVVAGSHFTVPAGTLPSTTTA